MSKLRRLSLHANQLTGNLGIALFSGSIPDVFGGMRMLESINLAFNRFNDGLPPSLSRCPMLRVIRLRNDSLSGEIAIDFKFLPNLNTFDIEANYLTGAIPPGIALCTELRALNLAMNNLVGEIPETFKDLRSLSYLALTGNGFRNLSSALQNLQHLPNLISLVLTGNFCGGETMPVDGINGF